MSENFNVERNISAKDFIAYSLVPIGSFCYSSDIREYLSPGVGVEVGVIGLSNGCKTNLLGVSFFFCYTSYEFRSILLGTAFAFTYNLLSVRCWLLSITSSLFKTHLLLIILIWFYLHRTRILICIRPIHALTWSASQVTYMLGPLTSRIGVCTPPLYTSLTFLDGRNTIFNIISVQEGG